MKATLLVALLGLATSVRGADLWGVLDPARIGASKAEISEQLPLKCEPASTVQRCVPARTLTTFAGLRVDTIELVFEDARLTKVVVMLSDRDYEALLGQLADRFGPGEDRSFRARAGMSGELMAGVYLWRIDAVRLVLEQFAGKIDRSSLVYGTDAALADLVREKTSYPPGTRRDL